MSPGEDGRPTQNDATELVWHLVVPYSIVFVLAVSGNVLVMATLVFNKSMRTVTNIFLFNLAVSDFLLGVFCMPFTLSGVLFREFIFGRALCKLIPYFQAVSVSVSVWTLVSMSVERYFAICHPLRSRKWQTPSHACRMICVVWLGSALCMIPILLLSKLQSIKGTGKYKCRESWPSKIAEKAFTIFLDTILLLIPLVLMSITYSLIIKTLRKAMKISEFNANKENVRDCWKNSSSFKRSLTSSPTSTTNCSYSSKVLGPTMRRNNIEQGITQKKRVIKMLFVVVLEFFICWTPLYTVNTISLFDPVVVYSTVGYGGISYLQLLAYTSSCCNPVTYCFMNKKFRESFLRLFSCCKAGAR